MQPVCRHILFCLFAAGASTAFSQSVRPKLNPGVPIAPALANKQAVNVKTTDFNGRPYQAIAPDAEGSPFFLDSLSRAVIILNKGSVYENVSVRLDLVAHELLVVNSSGQEIIAQDGLVSQVDLIDSLTGQVNYRFITGCPPVDHQNENHFYQVLSEGRLRLLQFTRKDLEEEKDLMSGATRQLFKERSELYTLLDEKIAPLKRDKESILALMNDHRTDIEAWLKSNKMNWKNVRMLTSLFDYYNSLKAAF